MSESLTTETLMENTPQFAGRYPDESTLLTEVNTWSDFAGAACWTEDSLTVSLEGPGGVLSWQSTDRPTLIFAGELHAPEVSHAMDDAFASKWGETLLSPQLCRHVPAHASLDVVRRHYERANAQDELDRLLYIDLKMAIWGNDLPKVTTAARIAGLRVRFPFLDPRLAAFTGTLPPHLKVWGLKKRYLFKRAVADLLPAEILHKPKQGFGVPVAEWIRTDPQVREAVLDPVLDPHSLVREYVAPKSLHSIVEKHLRGCWNYGGWLWATMILERWIRTKRVVQYICILLGLIEGEVVVSELVVAGEQSER